MKNKRYKILVLSDLKSSTDSAIKNTIELAKIIDGDIEFFNVTKPTDVVNSESQLSAKRNINRQSINIDKKIKQLLEPILVDNTIKINSRSTIGNVKNEIQKRIDELQPDIVVLGRRKSKSVNLIGDKVTEFILKNYKGAIMIASRDNVIDSKAQLSLGALNSFEGTLNKSVTKALIDNAEAPLKAFKIGDFTMSSTNEVDTNNGVIEYVFEDNADVVNTLSGYVSKNKIDLLCLDRGVKSSKTTNFTKGIINKVEASLLII
ncbi:universal stress protein [Winogradskyella sp.]|jgi:nucleotide-binding universal stress UspA family protein|uniref:universal stress protein n=1 Tax=Winogradskyella sp. TaxID=1883156 RepID=UPI0025E98557|nr:universal stress protein [Winogradskyella sp.]MCT4628485.1 universal stress protein [Winogradskyella sp.]